jgi:hypothetical protein
LSRPKTILADVLQQAEREIACARVEHCLAYDVRGREVLRKSGDANSVALSETEQSLVAGAIIVHNHPDEQLPSGVILRDIPPSPEHDLDVLLMCQLKQLRIVTRRYRYVLSARPVPEFERAQNRHKSIDEIWKQQYAELRRLRRQRLENRHGTPLPPEIEVDYVEKISEDAHQAWRRAATQCHLYYRREKRS